MAKTDRGKKGGLPQKTTTRRRSSRGIPPAKPYATFPLYAHGSGQWAKRIRGKHYYFGPWADPYAALEQFLAEKDFLYAGRPVPAAVGGVTLDEVVNGFLTAKLAAVDQGRIGQRHFLDYKRDGRRVLEVLGRARPADGLGPGDFSRLRAAMAGGRNATTVSNIIIRVRSMFAWAATTGLLAGPADYGGEFSGPAARELRRAATARGRMDFTAGQVRGILAACGDPALRAMAWLGVNAGLGNTDCARLEGRHISRARGGAWLDFPRPKTDAPRRAWLWPETVAAVEAALAAREAMERRDKKAGRAWPAELAGLVFVTRRRRPFVSLSANGRPLDSIRLAFGRVLDGLGLHEPGRGFYCLRRTFRTVADNVRDWPAVDLIMGHLPGDVSGAPFAIEMAARYRGRIADARLQAVAEHVRAWLDPEKVPAAAE